MCLTRWSAAACLCCTAITGALPAQPRQPRVVVKRLQDSDLERTAHALRVSVERVQQARQVLDEATRLLEKAAPHQLSEGSAIPHLWLRLNRSQAVDRLEGLILHQSRRVSDLEDFPQYAALTKWMLQAAGQMAMLHPSRALQAVEGWPAPPDRLGESAQELYEEVHSRLAADDFPSRYSRNPPAALSMLLENSSPYSRILSGLNEAVKSRDRRAVNRLIDEFLGRISTEKSDTRMLYQLGGLLRRSRTLPHDREDELTQAMVSAYQRFSESRRQQETYIYEMEGQTVELDAGEQQFLRDLRRFAWQPEMTLRLADSWPALHEKIDRLGGLDRAMSSRLTRVDKRGEDGSISSVEVRNIGPDDLFQELLFEAAARPGWVRRRLDEFAQQQEDAFNRLMQLARKTAREQPELAAIALESARTLIDQEEEPSAALKLLMPYMRVYREFEGVPDAGSIQQGFRLLAALEEENRLPEEAKTFLIGEWALVDLAGSLTEARTQGDIGGRLRNLTSILRALTGTR